MTNKKKSTTNPFILFLIILVSAIVGYVFYSQSGSRDQVPIPAPDSVNDVIYLKFKDIKYDFALIEDQSFNALKTYGEFPIQPGTTGKEDIFNGF